MTDPTQMPMFYDIDDAQQLHICYNSLKDAKASNFVVEFGSTAARCATNLGYHGYTSLIKEPRSSKFTTRWINFWGIDDQRDTIKKITSHYGVSPRLVHLICPKEPTATPTNPPLHEAYGKDGSLQFTGTHQASDFEDTELGVSNPLPAQNLPVAKGGPWHMQEVSFKHLVEQLWHFCSIDFGDGYLHIGMNLLFSVPELELDISKNKPQALRIWASFVLFKDGTVLSVYQNPEGPARFHPEAIKTVRGNALNIFRQLAVLHVGHEDSLMTITIRNYDKNSNQDPHKCTEPANLLLYYLLDDWTTIYQLVTRRDHPYRSKLDELRTKMLYAPDVSVIDKLHVIGRQLQTLKLMYQSYELVIGRILQRQKTMRDESSVHARNHRNPGPEGSLSSSADGKHLNHEALDPATTHFADPIGVQLSGSTIVRFERLLDRIRLLALTEIEECLNEKESLVMMNFNLIALKESQAIEKLTRITILLAKATVLFLPVSLMTGYFSVQIPDVQGVYTVKTYWLSFMVVMVLSILGLFIFEFTSVRLEGPVVYKSITRAMLERGWGGRRKAA